MSFAQPGTSPSRSARRRSVTRAAAAIAALAAAILLSAAPPAVAQTGGGVTVEVTGGPDSDTPSGPPGRPDRPPVNPPGPPGGSPPGRPGSVPGSGQVTQPTITDRASADGALGADAVSLEGVLNISGLTAEALPGFDIGNGSLTLSFVVRNTSAEPVDASAAFSVDNLFGWRIAEVADVRVDALQPDETRRVVVRLDGLGQQILLHSHVTLTPPATVAGVELKPMTRDTTAFVIPLLTLVVLAAGLGAWLLVRWLRQERPVAVRLAVST